MTDIESDLLDAMKYVAVDWGYRDVAVDWGYRDVAMYWWYGDFVIESPKTMKCECGKEKHGFANHSQWCDMSKEQT